MKGIAIFALGAALMAVVAPVPATAEPSTGATRVAQALVPDSWEPARPYVRPRARVRIFPQSGPDDVYPRYNPGPNAVRVCNATYVQEFRPSGPVIVPRMSCYWRRG